LNEILSKTWELRNERDAAVRI